MTYNRLFSGAIAALYNSDHKWIDCVFYLSVILLSTNTTIVIHLQQSSILSTTTKYRHNYDKLDYSIENNIVMRYAYKIN